ncbi:GNAT family N-acetyltransferase [Undibacterium terreum]|uniref:N-acetyltransferase domain-containing protein n=1 Tax=Undibacterium terreum TaxID=1224302 RepID=A0A916UA68_9BURK|nr:GNAT family N-acetyltransferase [Undibacterium terreum]GGC65471.1 hypothetical protein GCM10011396_10590 [Undibacterium terreum]
MSDKPTSSADATLIESWLRARSVCRGLPQPVSDRGGLRLETNLEKELRRYVFAHPADGLRALGEAITEPLIYLKLTGTGEQLKALLPARWQLDVPRYLMTCDQPAQSTDIQLPTGYHLETGVDGCNAAVRISDSSGSVAASGYAAQCHDVFIYDRIEVSDQHRRRGLGRAVMQALLRTRTSANHRQVLVATEEGRALYTSLGWSVYSPFSSAFIPAGAGAKR